jgi:hypothetical protein
MLELLRRAQRERLRVHLYYWGASTGNRIEIEVSSSGWSGTAIDAQGSLDQVVETALGQLPENDRSIDLPAAGVLGPLVERLFELVIAGGLNCDITFTFGLDENGVGVSLREPQGSRDLLRLVGRPDIRAALGEALRELQGMLPPGDLSRPSPLAG